MTSKVAPAELASWIASGEQVAVLDIRSAAEFAAEHVDGAHNLHVVDGTVEDVEKAGAAVVRGGSAWAMERQVRLAAGSLVLLGTVGGQLVSLKLRAVAAGVGGGLAWSGLTDTCGMAKVLSRMPWNRRAQDPSEDAVLEQLSAR